jgi:hypothetical protein
MKKMIFIELVHHHECLENPYLEFKNKWYQTKAILGEFVFNKIKSFSQYKEEFYVLKQPNRKNLSSINFLNKIKYFFIEFIEINNNVKELKNIIIREKPEALYVNTIESPFLIPLIIYLLKVKNTKIYLTMHNTNRIKISIKKYILFDFLIVRLIKKAYRIILLWEYLKFKDNNIQNKVIYFNNRIIKKNNSEKFDKKTFVMSWNLDIKTKDYESVLKWFSIFIKNNSEFKDKIELILLWQINETVAYWINKYNLSNVVKTFNEYVWEHDMEKYMWGAHYAIISTYENSIYGKYKISWAFWDAVGFNVPILLSQHYSPEYKSENITRFNNKEFDKLLTQILKWKNKKW